jgi:hypothetical protein
VRSATLLGVVLNHGITITFPLLGEVARYGNEDALRLVLDHLGHLREMNESNALTMAVISAYDNVGKLSMLLVKGMDIDFVGKMTYDWDFIQAATERVIFGEFEGTALHRAAHLGHVDAERFLLEKGARTDLTDSSEKYAMERAEMAKHLEVRDMIWSAFEREWEEDETGDEK